VQNQQSFDTFDRILNSYLSHSRLSLSQVAQKLEISKGQLSELKNKKKRPTLDKGIRILKFCGADIEQIRTWIDEYHIEECSEYAELISYNEEKVEKHKLKTKLARRMATNLELLHLYIDVLNESDKGISREYILRNYGEAGSIDIQYLISGEIVAIKEERFFPAENQNYSFIDVENSYDLMKSVFDAQKDDYLSNEEKQRCFQFTIEDVSEKGKEELKMAFEQYMKEVHKITKEHALPITQGGSRYIIQAMSSLMKTALILMISLMSFTSFKAHAGGVGGGDMSIKSLEFISGTFNFYIKDVLWRQQDDAEYIELAIQYNKPLATIGQGDPRTETIFVNLASENFDLSTLEHIKSLSSRRITGLWKRMRLAREIFMLKVYQDFSSKNPSYRESSPNCHYFALGCPSEEDSNFSRIKVKKVEIFLKKSMGD
jgi:transcriptional regulator with XRE-family HTH domain